MGRGLFARVPIKSHEPAAYVPLAVCMSTRSAKQQPYARVFRDSDLELSDDDVLALHLLYEAANPNSFWRPYIDLLPKKPDLPILWSPKDLDELQGSALRVYTDATLKQLQASFDHFQPILTEEHDKWFPESLVTFDAYKWAMAILMSRGRELRLEGEPARLLVPLIDLANWSPDVPTSVVADEAAGLVVLRTGRDYGEGQQILVSYGEPVSNWRLLQSYGFLTDNRALDEVVLDLQLSPSVARHEEKQELLAARGGRGLSHVLTGRELASADLLYAMRVSVLTEEEWPRHGEVEDDLPVSYASEVAVYEALYSSAQELRHRYRTNEQEDEVYAHAGLSKHALLAVKLRVGEKRILRNAELYYSSKKARLKELGPARYREET